MADIAWIELEIQREFLPVRPVLIAQCCSVFNITRCCRTDTLVQGHMKRQTDDDSPADTLSPLRSERSSSRQIVPKLSLGKCTPLSSTPLDTTLDPSPSFGGEGHVGLVSHANIFTFGNSSTALFTEKSITLTADRGTRTRDQFHLDLTKSVSSPDETTQSSNPAFKPTTPQLPPAAGAPFQFRQHAVPVPPHSPSEGPRYPLRTAPASSPAHSLSCSLLSC